MVELGVVFEAASALLLVGLGVLVLLVRPRPRAATAFSLFSILWGTDVALVNVAFLGLGVSDWFLYAGFVAHLAVAAALVWLTTLFPHEATRKDCRAFWAAGILGGGTAIVGVAWTIRILGRLPEIDPENYSGALGVFVMAYPVFLGSLLYAISLWSLRVLGVPTEDTRTRRQYALATAAVVSWVGFWAGTGPNANVSIRVGIRTLDPLILFLTGLPIVVLFACAAIWLLVQHRTGDAHVGRNMAWFLLALPLAGVLYTFMEPWGAFALTRVLATALLAIGILRFNLLSLDVKLRWTVSRSTVAASFLVVFFLASEGAQAFFGDRLQNEYLGIAAAGLLLLFLVPLKRVADRIAAQAVPGSGIGLFRGSKEGTYYDAVRAAMRDEELTPEEEVRLAALAEALGIGAARATEIRQAVDDETETRRASHHARRP